MREFLLKHGWNLIDKRKTLPKDNGKEYEFMDDMSNPGPVERYYREVKNSNKKKKIPTAGDGMVARIGASVTSGFDSPTSCSLYHGSTSEVKA